MSEYKDEPDAILHVLTPAGSRVRKTVIQFGAGYTDSRGKPRYHVKYNGYLSADTVRKIIEGSVLKKQNDVRVIYYTVGHYANKTKNNQYESTGERCIYDACEFQYIGRPSERGFMTELEGEGGIHGE